MSRPNILIMNDQYNAECFDYVGHQDVKIHNIDQLAAGGVNYQIPGKGCIQGRSARISADEKTI